MLKRSLLVLVAILGGAGPIAPAVADPSASDSTAAWSDRLAAASTEDLAPTSDPPWNPPEAMPVRRTWERVLNLPGRVVSLPLTAIGRATERGLRAAEQRNLIFRELRIDRSGAPHTIALKRAHFGDHTGLAAQVALNRGLTHRESKLRGLASYSASLYGYRGATIGLSRGPALLQYGYEWRPQDRFYGIGTQSSFDSVSNYASQTHSVRAQLQWAWGEDTIRSVPRTAIVVWGGPRNRVTRIGHENAKLSYHELFPELAPATLDVHVEHLTYGASLSSDQRTGAPHWTRGWRALVSAERYDAPIPVLALRNGNPEGAQFTRYRFESEVGRSFMRDPRTVRLLVRVIDQDVSAGRERMLFGDLSRLGGRDGVAGYEPGRFHDVDLVHAKVSYLFPLVRRLEVDVHSEWGAVYPDLWSDASFGSLKHSYGVALRGRDSYRPRGSIGVEVSPESVRLRYVLGNLE